MKTIIFALLSTCFAAAAEPIRIGKEHQLFLSARQSTFAESRGEENVLSVSGRNQRRCRALSRVGQLDLGHGWTGKS